MAPMQYIPKVTADKYFKARVTCRSQMFKVITSIKEKLNDKQRGMFKETCFGHFLNVSDIQFSGQICQHLLLREVEFKHGTNIEMWFTVGGKQLKFSRREFAIVTGLRFNKLPDATDHMALPTKGSLRLRETYLNDNPSATRKELESSFLNNISSMPDNDAVKMSLLYFLEAVLLGKEGKTKISEYYVRWVDDLEFFNKYPWGNVCFEATISSLQSIMKDDRAGKFLRKQHEHNLLVEEKNKTKKMTEDSYSLTGFPFAFQVWAYEALPELANLYAVKVASVYPRILNWSASKKPDFEELKISIFEKTNVLANQVLDVYPDEASKEYTLDLDDAPMMTEVVTQEESVLEDRTTSAEMSNDELKAHIDNVLREVKTELKAFRDEAASTSHVNSLRDELRTHIENVVRDELRTLRDELKTVGTG